MKECEAFERYAIKWRLAAESHVIDFDVRSEPDGGEQPPEEPCLSGSIKFDGCSNWYFHTDEVMMHFCDQAEAEGLGRLLGRLYQIARERLAVPAF